MRPRHFEIFHAVATAGSVTQAARQLRLSQPAVSKYLNELEQELGYPLRHRDGNRLVLSAEGHALYLQIARALTGFEQVRQLALDLRTMRRGHLAIACIPMLSTHPQPSILARFLAKHPELSVNVATLDSSTLIQQLSAGRFDVGISLHVPNHPEVSSRPLATYRLVCAVPSSHALASRGQAVSVADLEGEAVVTLGSVDVVQSEINRVLNEAGVRPARRIDVLTSAVALAMGRAGIGLALVDHQTAALHRGDDICFLPFLPTVAYASAIVLAQHQRSSRLSQAFAEEIVAYFEEQKRDLSPVNLKR